MTKKAEVLARELISLSQKYSEKEFITALELIKSGNFFKPMEALATEVFQKHTTPRKRATTPQSSAQMFSKNFCSLNYDNLLFGLPEAEQKYIRNFLEKIIISELLPTSADLRNFAAEIGLNLPKKVPSRQSFCKKLIQLVLPLNKTERKEIFKLATQKNSEKNTLKLWSDIIVGRNR